MSQYFLSEFVIAFPLLDNKPLTSAGLPWDRFVSHAGFMNKIAHKTSLTPTITELESYVIDIDESNRAMTVLFATT